MYLVSISAGFPSDFISPVCLDLFDTSNHLSACVLHSAGVIKHPPDALVLYRDIIFWFLYVFVSISFCFHSFICFQRFRLAFFPRRRFQPCVRTGKEFSNPSSCVSGPSYPRRAAGGLCLFLMREAHCVTSRCLESAAQIKTDWSAGSARGCATRLQRETFLTPHLFAI